MKTRDTDHLFDIDEITKLLHLPELVTKNVPWATAILGEGQARLRQIEDGLVEHMKKNKKPHPGEYPGMPVNHTPEPSKPIEEPKSGVAQEAPETKPDLASDGEPKDGYSLAPRAIPTRNVIGGMPGPAEAQEEPVTESDTPLLDRRV